MLSGALSPVGLHCVLFVSMEPGHQARAELRTLEVIWTNSEQESTHGTGQIAHLNGRAFLSWGWGLSMGCNSLGIGDAVLRTNCLCRAGDVCLRPPENPQRLPKAEGGRQPGRAAGFPLSTLALSPSLSPRVRDHRARSTPELGGCFLACDSVGQGTAPCGGRVTQAVALVGGLAGRPRMASGTDPAWGWGLVDQDGTVTAWHSGPGAASSLPTSKQTLQRSLS